MISLGLQTIMVEINEFFIQKVLVLKIQSFLEVFWAANQTTFKKEFPLIIY